MTKYNENPVLAVSIRGSWVENRHHGAFVVVDADGEVLASAGDIERPVFPRSCVKPMQALAMAASGAFDRFDFSPEDLAITCASHQGEAFHVKQVEALLVKIGANPEMLECGAHAPTHMGTQLSMHCGCLEPTALHNNCSGKHAGLLSVAMAMGLPTEGYGRIDHPVQQLIRKLMSEVTEADLTEEFAGTDGCSIPTWATPLRSLAIGFSKMATGRRLSPEIAVASTRLFDAATAHPHLVGGADNFDTSVMLAYTGRLFQKGGADAVQCGVIRNSGIAYALKVDDGNMAVSRMIAAHLLLSFSSPDEAERAALVPYCMPETINARGTVVGRMEPSDFIRAC